MNDKPSSIFFDKNDHELLRIVDDVLARGSKTEMMRSLLNEHMHPHGIKEMAAPKGLRIAYAIAGLLGSFEQGQPLDRIKALRSLRDEVFLSSTTFYQKNTARVLVQIMKDLLRCQGDELRRLKLAHDFRMVSTGNPRLVRAELARYHLLEMPEEWNQFAFDDHVHDANTKGRKSPTHLIMDAWIKGIRNLTVVYYNYVAPEVVEELVEASAILDMRVQVGIEVSSRFRDKYVRMTWEPHGFHDNRSFLKFLAGDAVKEMMDEGRHVSHYQQRYIFEVLAVFNSRHRFDLNEELELALGPLQESEFVRFVGAGQPSILHLARFIHNAIAARMEEALTALRLDLGEGAEWQTRAGRYRDLLKKMGVEQIIEEYLLPSRNPELRNPNQPRESPDLPELLRLSPPELLRRLLALHSSSRFTLNLSNLTVQDTLELLYSCDGMISHIEAYNLKNAAHGMSDGALAGRSPAAGEAVQLKSPEYHYRLIGDLQKALNEDNVIGLKRAIRAIIWDFEEQRLNLEKQIELLPAGEAERGRLDDEHQQMQARKRQLMDILYHLEPFHNFYRKRVLGSRIGSGSTGQVEDQYGMGLVILDTLPARARKEVWEGMAEKKRRLIPVSALLTGNTHRRYHEFAGPNPQRGLLARLWPRLFARREWHDWSLDGLLVHPGTPGNIATLGGLSRNNETEKSFAAGNSRERLDHRWKYLNTNLKNSLKVLLGLVPAFLTFYLTKDWWVLAWLGAFIWFGITGSRNILQSVLGGGGLRRSPLLPWNSLVSWSRIADSLLYTGFSVPLLDYLVKTMLLDRTFGVTTASNPVLLYAVMGLANGIYISGHNVFRGLPRTAAVGNFFRSILAIPLAIVLNGAIGLILQSAAVPDVAGALQKWAAIISKLASDCVAAVIEGLADRQTNIRLRLAAYRAKLAQLFGIFARLDLLFPEEDVLEMLQSPKMMLETLNHEAREQERLIIVNALDLMYLWMYQPRARKALMIIFHGMSREEWLIFYRSQLVLKRYREISQIFVDGLVGRNFSKALSFYLDRFEGYLADMEQFGLSKKWV